MDISLVLQEKYPEAEWVLTGAEYSGLEWLSETKKPTLKQIEKAWQDLQAERELAEEAKKEARQSALAKLSALGLTEDEVQSLLN